MNHIRHFLGNILRDAEVIQMSKEKFSVAEISQALNIPIGEVERVQAANRAANKQRDRNRDTLERMENEIGNAAWRIK